MKKILYIMTLFIFGLTAYADDPAEMPEKGIERIKWAVQCSGEMPEFMIAGIALLALCAVITVIYYKKTSGGKGDE